MPILTPCPQCRALIAQAQHCPTCQGNTSWNGTRDRSEQRRFRNAVLEHAGYRCQHQTDGHRCNVINVSDLQAHHTIPGNNHPATGLALCREHHRAADPRAR